MTTRKAALSAAFFVGVVVTVLLLVPLPGTHAALLRPALMHRLEDLCHPLVFALLAWVALRAMSACGIPLRPAPVALLLLTLACLGAGSEWLQQFTGRDESLSDFIDDMLGSWIGIALFCARRVAGKPRSAWLLSATAAALAAAAPGVWMLTAYGWRNAQSPVIWRADSRLLSYFAERQEGEYPGIALTEVPPDWQGYSELAITVRNPAASNSAFAIRVNDAQHNQHYEDRYNEEFTIPASTTVTYRISLKRILTAPQQRVMNLQEMTGVIVFQLRERNEPRIDVLQIALAR